jgi:hypothetical protein
VAKRLPVLFGSLVLAACASSAPAPRTNLDPLFRAPAGTGEYPVDPATLDRRQHALRTRRGEAQEPPQPEKDAAQPCKHTWQFLDRQTHPYVTRDGSIALCTPRVCTQCGLVQHECTRFGAR